MFLFKAIEIYNHEILNRKILFIIYSFLSYKHYTNCKVSKWQIEFIYIMEIYHVIFYPSYNIINYFLFIFLIFLFVTSLVFPVVILPIPNGNYPVGTTKLIFEKHLFKVWYPTDKKYCSQKNRDLYFEEEYIKPFAKIFSIYHLFIQYFTIVKTHSFCDAPLLNEKEKYPIIIFSHGLYGIPELYTLLSENLSSYGFIVFGIYHTDGSAFHVQFPNGKKIPYQTQDINREKQIENRVNDIQFLIKKIKELSKKRIVDPDEIFLSNFFDGRLDSDQISILGHSFGGITSIFASCLDSNINSCICLDPWLNPFELNKLNFSKRILFINAANWQTPKDKEKIQYILNQLNELSIESDSFILKDSNHQNFSDLPFIIPNTKILTNMLGKIDPYQALLECTNICVDFFNFKNIEPNEFLIKEKF